jgi:hypothetical protein
MAIKSSKNYDVNSIDSVLKQIVDAVNPLLTTQQLFNAGYVPGKWYPASAGAIAAAGGNPAAGTLYLVPFVVGGNITVDQLAATVTTLAAGGNLQLALYATDPLQVDRPGALLGTVSALSTAVATTVSGALAAPVALTPGVYWVGLIADASAAGVCAVVGTNGSDLEIAKRIGVATAAIASALGGNASVSAPATYGALSASLHGAVFTQHGSSLAFLLAMHVLSTP